MSYVFTVDQIRAAEQVLLRAESSPDELMRQAAHLVALTAEAMCGWEMSPVQQVQATDDRILLLVGAGGNGGDALYAGTELLRSRGVDAVLLGRDGRVHERALAAFTDAGGTVLPELPRDLRVYRLIVDGILGIGGVGGLGEDLALWLELARQMSTPILAVDVPSGVAADTGALPEPVETTRMDLHPGLPAPDTDVDPADFLGRRLPQHVTADATVTFGQLRRAHAVSPACGEVVYADIGIHDLSLREELHRRVVDGGSVLAWRAVHPEQAPWPEPLSTLSTTHVPTPEPGVDDDKYSGGVVGICAGSARYPGAAVLTTTAAVRATSAMVRYVGSQRQEVVRALPEVVASATVADTGRVQAWVVGPGRGTDDTARTELAELLARPEALIIDADALTLLAEDADLREQLRQRDPAVLLTPHLGEFRRLSATLDSPVPDPADDRIGAVLALSGALDCGVLLKGRHTVMVTRGSGTDIVTVDAGSSWAATPGSGDVLAGLIGAWTASTVADTDAFRSRYPGLDDDPNLPLSLVSTFEAVTVHGMAAWLAAQTPDGPGPTSALPIAEAIPRAIARLSR
ncbi:bifunctional ADP-dependent NAD(P)H-hydrate dehydratase/NAD(P)H-hydrate epimerase [Corynebacterium suedekumii]|uniref:ADP-dependent (S)-NAD(P)H-hydrate dehydratase n=1 Tax=Corynebacterium suedekumii TaxID=3049801 RepID=A0ABY8VRV9_9CORY|nr:bifunctional ADP-dependent NAD(P)H-hydrate dehydratase/NAD(P)H-hydrate epimerase [Corynebacterium suedekumii]WIM70923.1 NAD(P)H-hydrate dehydratase [Corynebacterium suedekumii]